MLAGESDVDIDLNFDNIPLLARLSALRPAARTKRIEEALCEVPCEVDHLGQRRTRATPAFGLLPKAKSNHLLASAFR